ILKALYFESRFYTGIILIILLYILANAYSFLYMPAQIILVLFLSVTAADILMLFNKKDGIEAQRILPAKFSNGDDNPVKMNIISNYDFKVKCEIIDELPDQFQKRDFSMEAEYNKGYSRSPEYFLNPVRRGSYQFGALNIYVSGPVNLVRRRYRFSQDAAVKVYPSFLQMKYYEQMVLANKFSHTGLKRIRRLGNTLEFEQISNYTPGDDYRTINWKASARRDELMVNKYRDETMQDIICMIDGGRQMKMPFEGMTLLDYAVNASLALSNIVIKKKDKPGLIRFSDKVYDYLAPSNRKGQMQKMMDMLYNIDTNFSESDFAMIPGYLRRVVKKRSMVMLFTNFESYQSMIRNIEAFRMIAADHLLAVIFFENTELDKLIYSNPTKTNHVYTKVIAEKLALEKHKIIRELNKHRIHTVFTPPKDLSLESINKYLEIKARRLL
ncbi:MAG: DUF58 domain-containing protein, partial [Bacteroidota bacterium]